MQPNRLIGYYQTFDPQLDFSQLFSAGLSHVHLASIHFGIEDDGQAYIHLNDLAPTHPHFDYVWKQMAEFKQCGGTVMLMIGGAGDGYTPLISSRNGQVCQALLIELLDAKKDVVDGIDYDVEQIVDLAALVSAHKTISAARPNLMLSFAPLASSLQSDTPGMGGFVYKDAMRQFDVNYFNGQFYGSFGVDAFRQAVDNGYPPTMIVMGCLAGQENATADNVSDTVREYSSMGGIFVWEIGQALPTPMQWVLRMRQALQQPPKSSDKCIAPSVEVNSVACMIL